MYLGIDLGTSSVKAVIVDDGEVVVAQASAPLTVSRPHPLFSEQDAGDWWSAALHAILQLPASVRASVRAIGLSGQMHGATLLDSADVPLRPAILWNDGRSSAQCVELGRGGAAGAHHYRQYHDARFHGAETAMGRTARAGAVRAYRDGAAAQGFSA